MFIYLGEPFATPHDSIYRLLPVSQCADSGKTKRRIWGGIINYFAAMLRPTRRLRLLLHSASLLSVFLLIGAERSHEKVVVTVGYVDGASYFANYIRSVIPCAYKDCDAKVHDFRFVRDPHPSAQINVLFYSVFGGHRARLFTDPACIKILFLYEVTFDPLLVADPDIVVCGFADCENILNRPSYAYLYLPLFALSFSEINDHSEIDLLERAAPKRKKPLFAAYIYSNCEVLYREVFFDSLQDAAASWGLKTQALGRCKGASSTPEAYHIHDRTLNAFVSGDGSSKTYLDAAIEKYAPFRWVIAFESDAQKDVRGVISEKVTSAMLAGAIPIYYGPKDVLSAFNPQSLIHCGDYASFDSCAEEVVRIDRDAGAYENMIREQWVLPSSRAAEFLNRSAFAFRLGSAMENVFLDRKPKGEL